MDLSTLLASWRAGSLKGPVSKGLLGYLEKTHKKKVERIRESRTMTPEMKRLEENEARREFRSDWRQMRSEILDGYYADVEKAKAAANPPASEQMLTRMGLLSNVHLPSWQRSSGNMVQDAERFAKEGDEAGLRLVREHVSLTGNAGTKGVRSTLTQGVDEALDGFKTDAQRKAEQDVRSLELEKDRFELGTGMREIGIIRVSTEPLRPAPNAPSPMLSPQR